jgi:hypothetical protein
MRRRRRLLWTRSNSSCGRGTRRRRVAGARCVTIAITRRVASMRLRRRWHRVGRRPWVRSRGRQRCDWPLRRQCRGSSGHDEMWQLCRSTAACESARVPDRLASFDAAAVSVAECASTPCSERGSESLSWRDHGGRPASSDRQADSSGPADTLVHSFQAEVIHLGVAACSRAIDLEQVF